MVALRKHAFLRATVSVHDSPICSLAMIHHILHVFRG